MVKEEIWKDVVGYEGLYEVSSLGNVTSLNYNRTGERRLLKLCKNQNGYPVVVLSKERKTKNHRVHQLVALAFIPNPDNKPHIDHINGIKNDNHVQNLRWCTHKENCNFSLAIDNRSKAQKSKILSDKQKANMSKTHKAKNPNSRQQIWERASKADEYPYVYETFNKIYNDPNHKGHQLVLDLIKKYTI